MKKCFKCGIDKPLEGFYKHPAMADGRVNKCKECNKVDVRENYHARKPQYQAYERARNKEEKRHRQKLVWSRETKRRHPENGSRYNSKYPDKYVAHYTVSNAIRDGRLIPQPCRVCGDPQAEAHHEDYSKPLEVDWLCKKHHDDITYPSRRAVAA